MTEPQASESSQPAASVVEAGAGEPREWLGVSFDLMATGECMMVIRMRFAAGVVARSHVHPHEQAGYVVSGRYRQTIAATTHELRSGDTYAIPGGVEHSMEAIEAGEIIDVFTPPREEFR